MYTLRTLYNFLKHAILFKVHGHSVDQPIKCRMQYDYPPLTSSTSLHQPLALQQHMLAVWSKHHHAFPPPAKYSQICIFHVRCITGNHTSYSISLTTWLGSVQELAMLPVSLTDGAIALTAPRVHVLLTAPIALLSGVSRCWDWTHLTGISWELAMLPVSLTAGTTLG